MHASTHGTHAHFRLHILCADVTFSRAVQDIQHLVSKLHAHMLETQSWLMLPFPFFAYHFIQVCVSTQARVYPQRRTDDVTMETRILLCAY